MSAKRTTAIIICLSFLTQVIFPLVNISADLSDPGALSSHAPIAIVGDGDFTLANGVVTGDGSAATPYIIENWTIDATSDYGITIFDTTANFIIRNCMIFNGTNQSGTNDAIYLSNVRNGTISDNRIFDSRFGINLGASTNITVEDNTIYDNVLGIYLGSTVDSRVQWNIVNGTTGSGIGVYLDSTNNSVAFNELYDMPDAGLFCLECSGNRFYNNTAYNMTRYGMWFDDADDNTVHDNDIYDNGMYGIFLDSGSVDNDLYGNVIFNNSESGVFLNDTTRNDIYANEINNNTLFGLFIQNSTNDTFSSNDLSDNRYHIGLSGTSADHYNHTLNKNNTVDGKPVHYLVGESGKTVPSDAGFVGLIECDDILVENTTISNSQFGILLHTTGNSTLNNNTVHDSMTGIMLLSQNDGNLIINNTVHDNAEQGVSIRASTDTDVINNTVYGNVEGVQVSGSDGTHIDMNRIRDNTGCGIVLELADTTTATRNHIRDNSLYGISVDQSDNGLVYDNYFNNTDNYFVNGGSGNRWNITKTLGRNLMGGPWRGGNFWSNYTGSDTDGDTLGDTQVPYGPGDELPLMSDMVFPGVLDNTTMTPTTGDSFTFNASAWDDLSVMNVTVTYWFKEVGGDTDRTNSSMTRISGDKLDGEYNLTIGISSSALVLVYYLGANDTYDNWNITPVEKVLVMDDDPPEMTDHSSTIPTTGDGVMINATVTDNINLTLVNLTYWFDAGPPVNVTLGQVNGTFLLGLSVPSDASELHYILSAMDNSSNWRIGALVDLTVIDDDLPWAEDLTGDPVSGEELTFICNASDNRGVDRVVVEYWYDTGPHRNDTMVLNGTHGFVITVPIDARVLHYRFRAYDGSNNLRTLSRDVNITDSIGPEITDLTVRPTTGDQMTISVIIDDNWGISEAFIEHWIDSGQHINISHNGSVVLAIPPNARMVHYIVSVQDISGNSKVLSVDWDVLDNDHPMISDGTGTPTTGDEFHISTLLDDNIGIDLAYIEYHFDDDPVLNVSHSESYMVMVPDRAFVLHYTVTAFDGAGNKALLVSTRDIVDNDPPSILDISGTPENGAIHLIDVEVSDNLGVFDAVLAYWFDEGLRTTRPMMPQDGHFIYSIKVPANAMVMGYTVTATDVSDMSSNTTITVDVKDTIQPAIADKTGTPTTGEELVLALTISDNREVSEATIEYWFNNETSMTTTYSDGMTLQVPPGAAVLHMRVRAKDGAGNEKEETFERFVRDNDGPLVADMTKGAPKAGEDFSFRAKVEDNIAISRVVVEYWFTGSGHKTAIMALKGDTYVVDIEVEDKEGLSYVIKATDTSGNSRSTQQRTLSVEMLPLGLSMLTLVLLVAVIVAVMVAGIGAAVIGKRRKRERQEALAMKKAKADQRPKAVKEDRKPRSDKVWKAVPTKTEEDEAAASLVPKEELIDDEEEEEVPEPKPKPKKDLWTRAGPAVPATAPTAPSDGKDVREEEAGEEEEREEEEEAGEEEERDLDDVKGDTDEVTGARPGAAVGGATIEVMLCPDCGEKVDIDSTVCHSCGVEFDDDEEDEGEEDGEEEDDREGPEGLEEDDDEADGEEAGDGPEEGEEDHEEEGVEEEEGKPEDDDHEEEGVEEEEEKGKDELDEILNM